jgi:predicted amidophosphoribosyltransferase
VLLVDDVLTTGATVTAVAGLFLAVGVPRLSVWTVAWTPPARQVERKV